MDEKEIEEKMTQAFEMADRIYKNMKEKLELCAYTSSRTVSISIMATEIFKWLKKDPEKK